MNSIQAEFKALQNNQRLLVILIFSLVTVVIWVTISLITSQRTTTISPELQALAVPLNPNIDENVLSTIEQKRSYSDQELSAFPIYVIPNPTDESPFGKPASASTTSGKLNQAQLNILNSLNTPPPTASPSAEPSPTAEPTASPTPATESSASPTPTP